MEEEDLNKGVEIVEEMPGEYASKEEIKAEIIPLPSLKQYMIEEEERGGGMNDNKPKEYFEEEQYKPFNRPCFILIYLISEAIKEINDGEYSVNSEKFKPNEKQKNILQVLTKLKEYIEHYKKYPINELKMNLNTAVVNFLKLIDDETKEEIHKKLLKNIYEKRGKNLTKQESYKKYYESIYNTIKEDEVKPLMNKLIKPVNDILETIKIDTKLKIFNEKIKARLTGVKANNITMNKPLMGIKGNVNKIENLLPVNVLEKYESEYNADYPYPEIEKRKIEEFKNLIQRYKELINKYYSSNVDTDKLRYLAELDSRRQEIIKMENDLKVLFNYNKFMDEFKDKLEGLKQYEENYKEIYDYYVNGAHIDKEMYEYHDKLQKLKQNETNYKKCKEEFYKLTEPEKNYIKNEFNVFDEKKQIEGVIENVDNLEMMEIKIYLELFVPILYNICGVLNKNKELMRKDDRITVFNVEGNVDNYYPHVLEQIQYYYNIKDNKYYNTDFNTLYNEKPNKNLIDVIEIVKNQQWNTNKNINTYNDIYVIIQSIYNHLVNKDIEKQENIKLSNKAFIEQLTSLKGTIEGIVKPDTYRNKLNDEIKKVNEIIISLKDIGIDFKDKIKSKMDFDTYGELQTHYINLIDEIIKTLNDQIKDNGNGDGNGEIVVDGDGLKPFTKKIGGMINPLKTQWEGPTGLIKKINGGNITAKDRYKPSFAPDSKNIKDVISNIDNKRKIRETRINNFNRAKIRANINNNSGEILNSIGPEILQQLNGSGTFLTKDLNNMILKIKKEGCQKL